METCKSKYPGAIRPLSRAAAIPYPTESSAPRCICESRPNTLTFDSEFQIGGRKYIHAWAAYIKVTPNARVEISRETENKTHIWRRKQGINGRERGQERGPAASKFITLRHLLPSRSCSSRRPWRPWRRPPPAHRPGNKTNRHST